VKKKARSGRPVHAMRWAGVVLSAAWIAGTAAYLTHADVRAGTFIRNSAFEVCDYVGYRLGDYADCWRDLMKVAGLIDDPWTSLALISLAPVLLAWSIQRVTGRVWQWLRSAN
jgi:hypothetical protein